MLLLTSLALLASLVWAVAPETAYDSLNYHLAVPRFYLEAGGIIDLPYFFHSYFAHLQDHFYGLCMALQGEMAAKLANFVIAIASGAAVYCLGRMVFTPRVGLWAAALYFTTPLIGSLAGTTYTDLTVAVFLTMAVVALLRWQRSKQQGWMVVCAVFAGGAVGVKLNAMYGVIGLGLVIAILLLRGAESSREKAAVSADVWHAGRGNRGPLVPSRVCLHGKSDVSIAERSFQKSTGQSREPAHGFEFLRRGHSAKCVDRVARPSDI